MFDLTSFEARFDLPLPRTHPELHRGDAAGLAGPGPELCFIDDRNQVLALTLDAYGAVAFADLSGVLKGRWSHLDYQPSSMDDSWGTSFPDRGTWFNYGERGRWFVPEALLPAQQARSSFAVARAVLISRELMYNI